ncbi:hypothetical protein QJS10_CPA09g01144 [Acorus calamus]|uniref:Uncharacterized protein n=1 Tax=Acorus calamus TaxID=4465 RepID=A0AAV9E8U2_ACOCL|nr:hypothetical protein QJS10_CPA09g01144 [Acorus calamus]
MVGVALSKESIEKERRESSVPFVSLGRLILNIRRDQVHATQIMRSSSSSSFSSEQELKSF